MLKVDITPYDMPPGSGWEAHAHDDEALLSYAASGSCTQIMATRTWVVLPAHAVDIGPIEPAEGTGGPAGDGGRCRECNSRDRPLEPPPHFHIEDLDRRGLRGGRR